ncbi:MAG: 50S ribosomal protein L32 [Candidatus Nitrohelix vancouverensis]|uniref:Large ribosomal subunit protein bL32 n=1 Tax=Candidatus Nitrohelix vancouverensis TaxID=2705534 RepID=A0A7T0C3I2_9BACT|nr:MAG: 50S ribosomal protein L32 [Candidatus Nitrohelix vancouverensis]
MPVPKKRMSKSRQGNRRSHDHLKVSAFNECPQCHEMKRPHHICLHCGFYKDKEVMEVESI